MIVLWHEDCRIVVTIDASEVPRGYAWAPPTTDEGSNHGRIYAVSCRGGCISRPFLPANSIR